MRILLFAFAISFTTGFYAQVKSGKIIYQLHDESEYSEQEPDARFVIEFNELFTWYGKEEYENDRAGWTLENKSTLLKTSCYVNNDDKFVQFYIENPADDEVFSEPYYDDEPEPELENYHENYYEDLMRFKVREKDTIIEKTDETKEILGFTCKKAILKIRNRDTLTIWYTKEIVGLESLFKLASWIDGTILSFTSANEYGNFSLDAIQLDQNSKLVESELYTVPKGYSLRLETVYLSHPEYDDPHIEHQLNVPSFISVQSPEETIRKIANEIDKSIHYEEYDRHSSYIIVIVTFDEKGVVSSVKFGDKYNEYATDGAYNEDQLAKAIKKNCALEAPAKLNGKPVSLSLKVDYSYYEE